MNLLMNVSMCICVLVRSYPRKRISVFVSHSHPYTYVLVLIRNIKSVWLYQNRGSNDFLFFILTHTHTPTCRHTNASERDLLEGRELTSHVSKLSRNTLEGGRTTNTRLSIRVYGDDGVVCSVGVVTGYVEPWGPQKAKHRRGNLPVKWAHGNSSNTTKENEAPFLGVDVNKRTYMGRHDHICCTHSCRFPSRTHTFSLPKSLDIHRHSHCHAYAHHYTHTPASTPTHTGKHSKSFTKFYVRGIWVEGKGERGKGGK